jgi:uncharacterized protein (TIGR02466 family)
MSRDIELLFPSPIQISMVENAAAMNPGLLKAVEAIRAVTPNGRPESWMSTVYTTLNSADQLHQAPEFAGLAEIILGEVRAFADALGINHQDYPLRFQDCWFNIYGPKDGQESHIHPNSVISGSYYLKAPEGCSGIMFHAPMSDTMFVPPYREINALNTQGAEMPVQEGALVLFRSWLKHSVRPSPATDERISISFNLMM